MVGGGDIAAHKIGELIEAGAEVTVIAPEYHRELERRIAGGQVKAIRARYEGIGQLQGAWLAVAATDDETVNAAVCRDAAALGLFCNNVADAALSSLIMPRTIRRGGLVIAVSTSGASPGLTKRIAAQLERQFDETYAEYIDFLHELREEVKRRVESRDRRALIFEAALQPELREAIRRDRRGTMERLLHLPEKVGTESTDETNNRGGHKTERAGADPDRTGD